MRLAGLVALALSGAEPDRVECWTIYGPFTIQLFPSWAPHGVRHFTNLVEKKYYDDMLVVRTEPGFVLAQFGEHGDSATRIEMQRIPVLDDEDKGIPFAHGTVSFAGNPSVGRNTVIFIAGDGPDVKRLGKEKFERPIGRVASQEDLAVLAKFTSTVERSFSPTATHSPSRFVLEGNDAALAVYPDLEKLLQCRHSEQEGFGVEPTAAVEAERSARAARLASEAGAEMQAWRSRPSVETLPQRVVETCEKCHAQGAAFCVSSVDCAEDRAGACLLGPQDHFAPPGSKNGETACTREALFRNWPFEPCRARRNIVIPEEKDPYEALKGIDWTAPGKPIDWGAQSR